MARAPKALDADLLDPDDVEDDVVASPRHRGLALFMLVCAVLGFLAAFELTREKFHQLEEPGSAASCDFSVLVQCSANLRSWQGSLFGFPNPLLGLVGWTAVAVVAVGLLAGLTYPRWWWRTFAVGVTLGQAFVVFLVWTSIYRLATLCPWCMVTWAVVIPMFVVTWLWTLREGVWTSNEAVRARADTLLLWAPPVVLAAYAVIAVLAQMRLDVLGSL